jgi:hypothetical protein
MLINKLLTFVDVLQKSRLTGDAFAAQGLSKETDVYLRQKL